MSGTRIENKLAIELLYKMMIIRAFENIVGDYKLKRQIYGMVHCCNGQEAIAVGICSALRKNDYVISTHRPHGHAIAKGINASKMMAEIFGKATGTNGGKGGSMHISGKEVCFLPSTGIVGSGIPVACGAAFAAKYKKEDRISCAFFGDGAANEGIFHECLNFASIWDLPVLFVLENNGLAVTTQTRDTSVCSDYTQLASVYRIKALNIDGQDVETVYTNALEAADFVRSKSEPMLIQANTIRFNEHAEGEYYLKMRQTNYRDNEMLLQQIRENCPIKRWSHVLLNRKIVTEKEILELEQKANDEINSSLEYALQSVIPIPEVAFENVY